ncbi:Hypothetical predicted protein, partial [Olea europaea subsp. europaea]
RTRLSSISGTRILILVLSIQLFFLSHPLWHDLFQKADWSSHRWEALRRFSR